MDGLDGWMDGSRERESEIESEIERQIEMEVEIEVDIDGDRWIRLGRIGQVGLGQARLDQVSLDR